MLRKLLAFALLLGITSLIPAGNASAADTQNLSTATTCKVSLQAKWEVFGIPYPCFATGTQLSISTPGKTKLGTDLFVKINSEVQGVAWGSVFSIPKYALGLNSVKFGINDKSGTFVQIGEQINFIIYSSSNDTLRTQSDPDSKPYVVVLRPGVDITALVSKLGLAKESYMASSLSGSKGAPVSNSVYVMDLNPSQLSLVQGSADVESVSAQEIIYGAATQTNPPSWGLDRIDQSALPLNNSYQYKGTGKGVEVYVIDSGINASHADFAGRIGNGKYLTALGSTSDCNGHGTHVSGTIAGSTYGVAKEATIIPVRVFGCTGGVTTSNLIAVMDWVIDDHESTTPAVVNMSLGATYNSTINAWIQAMINDGLVVVVSAGNEGDYACNYSPASAPNAITVGNSTNMDQDALSSNVGSCVDLFAPGTDITSAWIGSPSASNSASGTSMASPHVAGAAALVLEADFSNYSDKLAANASVRTTLVGQATSGALFMYGQSPGIWYDSTPNLLLNTSALTGPALTPTFSTATPNAGGFTLQISNYSPSYTWAGSNSDTGTVVINGSGLITVTGIAPGVGSTVTITTTRTGYTSGSATSSSISSLTGPALTPTFSTATPNAGGFTLQISNYSPSYTWAGSNSDTGTVAINSSGLITVTGIAPGVGSTVTITTTRTGYASGSATSSSIASLTGPALTPTFGTATPTADGFTLQISNYSPSYTWAGSNSDTGTVVINGSGLITVAGIAPGVSSTVTITTTRTGYASGSATSSSASALLAALSPTFSTATPTATGFTLQISNYSPSYTWAGSNSDTGTVVISGSGLITVTGIAPGVGSTVTITTTRSGYTSGSATSSSIASLTGPALTPTFSTATPTAVGFTLQISNYSPSYTWAGINSSTGTVAINSSGLITVTGIAPGVGSTVTITTTRSGYTSGSSTSSSISSVPPVYSPPPYIPPPVDLAALIPAFSISASTAGGFTLQISNYDANYTWLGTNSSSGTVAISATGLITVSGIAPEVASTVTVTTSRAGYTSGVATSRSITALPGEALTPTLGTATPTADGFTLQISDYSAPYTWAGTNSSTGTVAINSSGLITVTGIAPGVGSTVTITTTRTGYTSGSATSSSISSVTGSALTPTFGTATPTADGFTLQISSYDANYAWLGTNSSVSTVAINDSGLITVTGIAPGVASTVTITTTRTGYTSGSATSSSISSLTGPPLTPTFGTATSTVGGFTLQISNYSPSYIWTATSSPSGTVAINGSGLITVTGLAPGVASTVTITTTRTGYTSGSAISLSGISKSQNVRTSSISSTANRKEDVAVGKRIGGVTPLALNFASQYSGKVSTIELGALKAGKWSYIVLGQVKFNSLGDATFKSKANVPKGSMLRFRVGGAVIYSYLVK